MDPVVLFALVCILAALVLILLEVGAERAERRREMGLPPLGKTRLGIDRDHHRR